MSFRCQRCGNCCRWEGCVKLEEGEADNIAAFLGLTVEVFLDRHTALTPDRQHLSLLERADGGCEFLSETPDGAACVIDPVKPRQCRAFPTEWNFPGWENECAGGGMREAN